MDLFPESLRPDPGAFMTDHDPFAELRPDPGAFIDDKHTDWKYESPRSSPKRKDTPTKKKATPKKTPRKRQGLYVYSFFY